MQSDRKTAIFPLKQVFLPVVVRMKLSPETHREWKWSFVGVGVALLEEVCHKGWTLRFQKLK